MLSSLALDLLRLSLTPHIGMRNHANTVVSSFLHPHASLASRTRDITHISLLVFVLP
jgi:hypothetical protein